MTTHHSTIYTHDIRNFSLNYPTGCLELVLCGHCRPWYTPGSLTGEHLSTETKEQRSWISAFSSIKSQGPAVQRTSFMSFTTLQNPREPQASVGKPPCLFVAVLLQDIPTTDPPLLVFLSLLITKTSFLWSTILHWPWLQWCLSELALIFSPVSCVCEGSGRLSANR